MPLTIDLGDDLSGKVSPSLIADLLIRIQASQLCRKEEVQVEVTLSGKPLTAGQNRNLSWAVAGTFVSVMEAL